MSAEFQKIRVREEGAVYTIRLFYPERRNAIGPQMTNELLHALDAAHASNAQVIVLEGEGKSFCAGGDFAQMTAGGDQAQLPHKGDYADLLLAMVKSDKPIIAKVQGHAMGGGLGLVAASTFAIASDDASFGTPEINVGLFPMMIMAVLSRLIPRRRLVKMMLLGEKFAAVDALQLGLLNSCTTPAELDAQVAELAKGLASKSPMTMKLGLRAFAAQDDLDLERALPMLRDRLGECLGTDDAREGLMAFLEKRTPNWTGK